MRRPHTVECECDRRANLARLSGSIWPLVISMSRIALLPEAVACQVAAGEVVERPASVVKELVENSLDAESTRIEVLIRRGGNAYLRVIDNGTGMDRDDALLCLERHATSKILCDHATER